MDYRNPFNTKQSRTMQRSINGGFSAEPSFLTNPPVPRNYGDIEFSDDEDVSIKRGGLFFEGNFQLKYTFSFAGCRP